METVVVGIMTYCVKQSLAADILREAAAYDRQGKFEEALEQKKLATKIENDRLFRDEYKANIRGMLD
jgi:hypothetical protein